MMNYKIVIMLIGWILLSMPAQAQQVSRGEYFYNSYVDFGQGTSFTISQEETSLDVDISSLQDGLNVIFLRVRDNSGKWSHTNQSVFYKYEAQTGLQISEIEYLIDEYKQFGSGTKLVLEEGKEDYLIDLDGVADGLHVLYVRAKNNLGVWTMMNKSVFYIYDNEPTNIISLSYRFIGEDFESPVYTYGEFEPAAEIVLEQNQFMANAEGLEEGKTYEILLTAKNGKGQQSMVNTISFTYKEVVPIIISNIETANLTCFGSNDGSVTINATSDVGDLEYSLDNESFQVENIIGNLATGNYTAYVRSTDDPANVVQQDFSISEPEEIMISFIEVTPPTCLNSETGSFKVVASGGTGTLSYKLSTQTEFQVSDLFADLPAGEYTVVAKDENGCEKEATVTINPPTPISVTFSAVNGPSCPEDSTGGFQINATGGAGSFTYKLSPEAAFQTTNQFADLPAGEYTVTVRDGNGCESSSTVQLTAQNQNPPVPTISVQGTDGISEEVQLSSSSPTGNQWLRDGEEIPGATGQTIDITVPGNYQVKVTAASGCSATSENTVITSNSNGEIRTGNPTTLFPNPATDQVRVKFGREFYLEKITVINSQGLLTNTFDIQRMTDEVVIEVAGFVPGKYILLVEGVGLQERLNLIKR